MEENAGNQHEDGGKLILTAPYSEKTPSAGREQQDEPEPLIIDGSSDTVNKTHGNVDVQTGKQPYEPEVIEVPIDLADSDVFTSHNQPENKDEIVGDQNVISDNNNDSIGADMSKKIVNNENGECEKNKENDTPAGDGDMTETENLVADNKTNKTCHSKPTTLPMVIDDRQGSSNDKGLDIRLVDDKPDSGLLESSTIREVDGIKHFEMNVNLGGYTPDDIKVQLKDGGLQIDAEREVKTDTFVSYQKTQRKFSVPKSCVVDSARVEMNKSGSLRVTVPLKEEQNDY